MPDTPVFGPDDQADDVEALLREMEAGDHDVVAPPADVWDGIQAAIRDDEPSVDELAARRSRFSTRFLAAAAAIAVMTAGVAVVSSLRDGDADIVATADLAFDPNTFDPLGTDASATARLVERDGRFEIRLDDASLPDPETADLELWLIAVADDGSLDVRPVSLVDPESPGSYAVPAELDPDVYSVVDISIEPRDGDASHSGRSILRGELTT